MLFCFYQELYNQVTFSSQLHFLAHEKQIISHSIGYIAFNLNTDMSSIKQLSAVTTVTSTTSSSIGIDNNQIAFNANNTTTKQCISVEPLQYDGLSADSARNVPDKINNFIFLYLKKLLVSLNDELVIIYDKSILDCSYDTISK